MVMGFRSWRRTEALPLQGHEAHTVHFRHLQAEQAREGQESRQESGEPVGWGCGCGRSPGSPGLLVGAQTTHGAIPGATANAGVGGGEAAHSTERALGPGRGPCTGR